MRLHSFVSRLIVAMSCVALACSSGALGDGPVPVDGEPDANEGHPDAAGGDEVATDLCGRSPAARHPALLVVVDGLRPDYVTADIMPNVHALGERGVVGERSYAVYPTVTRANAPSISTGSYPRRHGILHNAMYLPEVNDEPFSTGSAARLRELDEATGGQMVTTRSMGELFDEAGLTYFATGSGGSGNSLLQNPRGSGRGIWTAGGFFVPASARDEAIESVGPLPAENAERTVWAFSSYLHNALEREAPDVTIVWINEPDANGHAHGVGAPETLAAAANVDEQIGRVLAAHEQAGHEANIFVTSDHGFTTSTGGFRLAAILEDAGVDAGTRVVAGTMIYVEQNDPARLETIVSVLRQHDSIGSIYTRPDPRGGGLVPGTLPMDVIQWDHPRNPDILVAPAWSDTVNENGRAGATSRQGTATHGSDSPYDLRIPLIAAGPDLKAGARIPTPTGNVDFAPTLLYLQGIEPPQEMDGRVLCELLESGQSPDEVHVHAQTHVTSASLEGGRRYHTELDTLQVGTTVYVTGARTSRD
jgi:predicted AlkP superfamily pyrophosphatase or phosphodiesterase